jgi:capsular polysaccharide biosynthesis protein
VPQFFELLGIELDESKLEIVKAEEFLIFESHLTLEQRVRVIRKHLLQEDNLSVENQKLFLTRKGHSRFDSSLEQQVLHYLPKRIEVCDPAELSVQEQIRKFSLTSELHGPHGGALTNMMFMPRKSKIIEYFSGYLKSTCYQDLAVACDLDYQSINVAKTT